MPQSAAATVNQNELRIIGMSRSGNHALIQWILAQLEGSYCFLNCCEGKSNPFVTARPMADGRTHLSNLAGFDLERERAGSLQRKDWFLFSHEDNYLGNACSDVYERHHDEWVGVSRRRIDLLLLRDPFNLFASRLRFGHGSIGPTQTVKMWKQHARQLLAKPRRLRHQPVLVRYNRWVRDIDYRRKIAEEVGFSFSDRGVDRVASCAGGSSFDGTAYDGSAQSMDLFGRWRWFQEDPDYLRLFDEELVEMSRAIFGPMPAERAVRARAELSSA